MPQDIIAFENRENQNKRILSNIKDQLTLQDGTRLVEEFEVRSSQPHNDFKDMANMLGLHPVFEGR